MTIQSPVWMSLPCRKLGTGVSVEAVDPVFQTKVSLPLSLSLSLSLSFFRKMQTHTQTRTHKSVPSFHVPFSTTFEFVIAQMLEMLKQTGRPRGRGMVSLASGFGTWLSGVDINTQMSFEALHKRAVAVVVDPVQSVKGKVVLNAFRLINPQQMMLGQEPRQTTSNIGYMVPPSKSALVHGLNRHYYQINHSYRKNQFEMQMLSNLHRRHWVEGLQTKVSRTTAQMPSASWAKWLAWPKNLERMSWRRKL